MDLRAKKRHMSFAVRSLRIWFKPALASM